MPCTVQYPQPFEVALTALMTASSVTSRPKLLTVFCFKLMIMSAYLLVTLFIMFVLEVGPSATLALHHSLLLLHLYRPPTVYCEKT